MKDYVRLCRARGRETFVPLAHPPGHGQVDFGEAIAIIGGVRQKFHFFCMDLPLSLLYDNLKNAVAKICGDGRRERTRAFTELASHYLFADRFGRTGKGNDPDCFWRQGRGTGEVLAVELHGTDPGGGKL